MTTPPLRMLWARGTTPVLAAPVPAAAIVTLPLLTSLALREFVVVTDDAEVEVCGHRFLVLGWVRSGTPGLLVEHDCPLCGVHA